MAKAKSKAGRKKAKVVAKRAKSRALPKKPTAKKARARVPKKVAPPKAAKAGSKRPSAARPATRPAAPAPSAVAQLAKRIVDLTIRGDDEGCFALYAPNVESQEMGVPATIGVEALREKFANWRTMTKESTWQAKNVWTIGNTIVIEWDGRVTMATGNTVNMREVAIHQVENGKIVAERFYYDRAAFQAAPADAPSDAAPPPPADFGS